MIETVGFFIGLVLGVFLTEGSYKAEAKALQKQREFQERWRAWEAEANAT